jgi:ribosomal protein S18 acetylase RimI-like enzyme
VGGSRGVAVGARAAPDAASARRIELRPSAPADGAFLTRVYASTRPAELALLAWSPARQAAFVDSQAALQQRAYADRHAGSGFEIVIVDGTPVGRLFLARGETESRVVDIALLPEHRGAGIGTQLLGSVLAQAAARGVGVVLDVDPGNPARRLYARLGFVVEAASQTNLSLRWTAPGRPAARRETSPEAAPAAGGGA